MKGDEICGSFNQLTKFYMENLLGRDSLGNVSGAARNKVGL